MSILELFSSQTLENKNIIIAGGSSGIGAATAIAASKLGANLILIGRNKRNLESVLRSLSSGKNQHHLFFQQDLSSFENTNKLFNRIRNDHSPIDGLVWSAGQELIKNTRIISEKDVMETFGASNFGFLGSLKSFSSSRFWSKRR